MKLKLTPIYVLTFLALTFLMHEVHEIAHTTVGRIICGCWGQRDFNVWGVCDTCNSPLAILATLAGPLFTFLMIWYGTTFLKDNNSNAQKSFGFSLIFANLPFARLLTSILGGGDEVMVIRNTMDNHGLSKPLTIVLIILVIAYPLFRAYKLIKNKNKIGWFLLFLLSPVVIDMLVVLGVMNAILQVGFLDSYWILGSPILVTVWTISVIIVYFLTRKNIFTLSKE